MHRRDAETRLDDLSKVFRSEGETATAPAEGARGADDYRKIEALLDAHGVAHAPGVTAAGKVQAGFAHGRFKKIPIFSFLDRLDLCADHLHPVAIEDTLLRQVDGKVER